MASYISTNQSFVIKKRKDGSAYLQAKKDLTRHIIGIGIVLFLTFLIGQIVNYRISQTQAQEASARSHIEEMVKSRMAAKAAAAQAQANKVLAQQKAKAIQLTEEQKESKVQHALVGYISTNYLISEKGAAKIVEATIEASKSKKVEPSLITAIIAIESRFNPYAKSKGNAEGLMQVIPYWHPEKMKAIGGTKNIIETRENIIAGTSTVKEYLTKFNNNKVVALQQYAGALDDKHKRYSNLVLSEKSKIDQWLASHMKSH